MTENIKQSTPNVKPVVNRPNETGKVSVQGFVRIFDPANKQVFVEKPA